MDSGERYDQLLDFLLDKGQASRSNIVSNKLFPELEGFQVQDLIDSMNELALGQFDAKMGNNGLVLFVNERTAHLKKNGGFKELITAKFTQQQKKEVALQAFTSEGFFSKLHSIVRVASGKLFMDGHYQMAILACCKAVCKEVQEKSGLSTDTAKLMEEAFSANSPVLRFTKDTPEQQGMMFLFSGLMKAVRNPLAHQSEEEFDQQTALEWLALASALLRRLEKVERVTAS